MPSPAYVRPVWKPQSPSFTTDFGDSKSIEANQTSNYSTPMTELECHIMNVMRTGFRRKFILPELASTAEDGSPGRTEVVLPIINWVMSLPPVDAPRGRSSGLDEYLKNDSIHGVANTPVPDFALETSIWSQLPSPISEFTKISSRVRECLNESLTVNNLGEQQTLLETRFGVIGYRTVKLPAVVLCPASEVLSQSSYGSQLSFQALTHTTGIKESLVLPSLNRPLCGGLPSTGLIDFEKPPPVPTTGSHMIINGRKHKITHLPVVEKLFSAARIMDRNYFVVPVSDRRSIINTNTADLVISSGSR